MSSNGAIGDDNLQKPSGHFKQSESKFQRDKIYIYDGGFATHVATKLEKNTMNHPLWSCAAVQSDPDVVVDVHVDFLNAGANLIGTNTYQISAELARKHLKFDDPVLGPHLLIESAADLTRKAINKAGKFGKSALVLGSIGPYGACLADGSEYTGSYIKSEAESRKMLKEWHTDRIKRLHTNGVTMFAVETMPSVIEALAVLDVLEDIPGTRCWLSFQCQAGGMMTAKGEPLDEVFMTLVQHPVFRSKVHAVGANCVHPRDVETILKQFNKSNHWSNFPEVLNYQKVPYVVYPNRSSWDPENKVFLNDIPIDFILERIKQWLVLGANVIGGCCCVSPDDISKISEQVFLDVFDAMEERAKLEDQTRNKRDDWDQVEQRLKKPSYEELKKKQAQMSNIKDMTGDGGVGAFSRMHHEIENFILEKK